MRGTANSKRSVPPQLTPWTKGQSGNPNGRPKVPEDVKALARANSKRAMQRVIELMESDDERVALMAAKELLERAWGKAAPAEESDDKRTLTINIVKHGDSHTPQQLDATAVSIRTVEIPGDGGETCSRRLPPALG